MGIKIFGFYKRTWGNFFHTLSLTASSFFAIKLAASVPEGVIVVSA
jgi:hypothetical protein